MPQVLNNEVDILNVANIDNDIRDSFTRAMIAGEEKETYCTRQGGYDINEFFIWTDRQIYKTKAVIAQGDTFILNTNIVLAGTLSDQMYQLFAQSPESIREVISNIEEGSTATKNYHAGEYFIWNDGFLYKVTAATINIGTAFVVDTNVVKCNNVTDELSSQIEALTNEVSARAELGAHQFFKTSLDIIKTFNTTGSWNDNVYTISGATITVNSDLSITVAGDNTADISFKLVGDMTTLEQGVSYKLSGCPAGGSVTTYYLNFNYYAGSSSNADDIGDGTTFNYNSPNNYNAALVILKAHAGANGKTFKPLISLATDPSTEYTPYAMTNRELTDNITIQNISSDFYSSLGTNITIDSISMFKQGKHIFGDIILHGTTNFSGTAVSVMTIANKYASANVINTSAILGTDAYNTLKGIGGLYCGGAVISITDKNSLSCNYAKISLSYVTA